MFIRLKLVGLDFDMLELEDNLPDRDFNSSIRTIFGKPFILIAPRNYATILFHFKNQYTFQNKKKKFFIEIFEITDNNLKILLINVHYNN